MNDFTPQKVLAVSAHADDNEFCFGGSIAKWIDQGAEVQYLIVTDGQRGSKEKASAEVANTRQNEQNQAAQLLGVSHVDYLGYEDGRMEISWELRRQIVEKIRTFRPDTVLTIDPTFVYSAEHNYVNHNDHRVVGQATIDAVYPLARDKNAFSELENLEVHKVENLLMYNLEKEHFFVDIFDCIDRKVSALQAHSSQVGDHDKVAEYISNYAKIAASKTTGIDLAEGFVKISVQ